MSEQAMNKASDLTLASKKAAMKLAGVSEPDRQWILDRLPPGPRAIVQSAYMQLQLIQGGKPLDFSAFFDADEIDPAAVQDQRGDRLINQLDYESVQQVLDGLSVDYVKTFLRCCGWLGKARYLSECDSDRRAEIEATEQGTVTSRSAQALADSVVSLAMNN